MDIFSSYSVKIKNFNSFFRETFKIYRDAVDCFIAVILAEWDNITEYKTSLMVCSLVLARDGNVK